MAIKITDLSNYTAPVSEDVLPVVDVASGVTKKIRADVLVGAFLPTGITVPFAGATSPSGWLLCNGQAVDRTEYSALFTLIGTTYGVGDGSTTFNVPDLRNRTVMGKGGDTEFLNLGQTGGSKTHTLTIAQMPSHTHTGTTNTTGNHTHNYTRTSQRLAKIQWPNDNTEGVGDVYSTQSTSSAGNHSHTFTTAARGSGSAFSILTPYLVENWIIKA